jgi:hypothetical protein
MMEHIAGHVVGHGTALAKIASDVRVPFYSAYTESEHRQMDFVRTRFTTHILRTPRATTTSTTTTTNTINGDTKAASLTVEDGLPLFFRMASNNRHPLYDPPITTICYHCGRLISVSLL